MVLRNLYWKIWNREMDLKLRNRVCARDVIKILKFSRAIKGFILIRHDSYQIYICYYFPAQ